MLHIYNSHFLSFLDFKSSAVVHVGCAIFYQQIYLSSFLLLPLSLAHSLYQLNKSHFYDHHTHFGLDTIELSIYTSKKCESRRSIERWNRRHMYALPPHRDIRWRNKLKRSLLLDYYDHHHRRNVNIEKVKFHSHSPPIYTYFYKFHSVAYSLAPGDFSPKFTYLLKK